MATMMASYVLFFTCSMSSLSSSARVKMAPDSGLISSQLAASLQIRYLKRHELWLRTVQQTAHSWRRLRFLFVARSHLQQSMNIHVPFIWIHPPLKHLRVSCRHPVLLLRNTSACYPLTTEAFSYIMIIWFNFRKYNFDIILSFNIWHMFK